MSDHLQVGKPSGYYTSHSAQLSLTMGGHIDFQQKLGCTWAQNAMQ